MRIFPPHSQPSQITLKQNSHPEQTIEQQTTHSDEGSTTHNPTDINHRQTTLRNVLPSIKSTFNTKPLQKSQTLQRIKLLNPRKTAYTITNPTSIKMTSQIVLFNKTYKPTSPTSKETTYNSTNPIPRETKSQIVLFSTRPALHAKPSQDSHTTQITKVQLHTPLPYQTIKTLLTDIMKAFMHLINQSHFLYNAVHIAVSSRLQHTTEMLTELCKGT